MDLCKLTAISVIAVCCLVHQAASFNIDLKSAIFFRGSPGTGFGYSAEYVRGDGDSIDLLVGAPRVNVTDQDKSGTYYSCPAFSGQPCEQLWAPPRAETRNEHFGEQNELFGMAMALADEKKALICAPMWSDVTYWSYNYIFSIGRCLTLPIFPDDKSLTPYHEYQKYISDIDLEGRKTRQMNYGMAEFGVSADGDGEGRVVVGSPGYSVSRGGVVVVNTHFMNFTMMTNILDTEPDSLLGYTVAMGNFCGPKRLCFAAANRQVQSKVYILEHALNSVFKMVDHRKAEQEYSSFGSSLSAVDVTGDGWADLLVGAPTFSHYSNDSQAQDRYDQGKVFVYISQGEMISGKDNLVLGATLSGDDLSFSRFGSAISSIGDINRDSFNDVAVGAPLEGEGGGAIYIYLGSRSGLANAYSQKIRGSDFDPPLSSFGAHISKATTGISDYSYPDFAVGAPLSDVVVQLKTRLIVNANADITADPSPVDKTNDLCPPQVAQMGSGCVSVTLCLNFTYSTSGLKKSAEAKFRSLDFDVDVEIDRQISADSARRVRLYNDMDGTTATSLHLQLTATSTQPYCRKYTAVLYQDQIHRNPFRPVELLARFSLNSTSFPGIPPMLNQSMPDTVTHLLRFKNQCGQDQLCETDLVLTGDVVYDPPSDVNYPFNVINDTQQVELVLDVVNRREMSFGLSLEVALTGYMEFWTVTGNTSVLCDDNEEDPAFLQCRGFNPIPEGQAVQIRLKFQAGSVPLVAENQFVTFQVKVMPSDPGQNPEMNAEDNAVTLKSQTAIVADVRLDGSSTPSLTYVSDAERSDVIVTHKLLVTNRGPSFLPATALRITLPFADATDSDIIVSSNVTLKQKGGELIECPRLLSTGSSTGEDGSDISSSSTTTTTTTRTTTVFGGGGEGGGEGGGGGGDRTTSGGGGGSGGDGDGGSTTTSDPFGGGPDIFISKRRRREAEVEEEEGKRAVAAPSVGSGTKRMDCSTYRCRTFQCPLSTLQANDRAEVNITVTLRRATITFPGNIDQLFYLTTTTVVQPDLALFHNWSEPKRKEVLTTLKRVTGETEINIWYIIGGVLGGLLLLLLIGVLAWRCGFFRREDKARLERLKRQSGFYEGNRSVKRKSQRASTSGSASGPEK